MVILETLTVLATFAAFGLLLWALTAAAARPAAARRRVSIAQAEAARERVAALGQIAAAGADADLEWLVEMYRLAGIDFASVLVDPPPPPNPGVASGGLPWLTRNEARAIARHPVFGIRGESAEHGSALDYFESETK